MVQKSRLEEEFAAKTKEEVKEEIKKNDDEIKALRKTRLFFYIRRLRSDFLFLMIVSLMFGFSLWAWFPKQFNWYRVIAFGFLWWLLFEELKIHKMFKNDS